MVFFGRRLRHAWMAMAWTFHVGVLALMAVLFPYPLFGIAFASMLPVERLVPLGPAGVIALRPTNCRRGRSIPSGCRACCGCAPRG